MDKGKREISVGFLEPRELEGDTIYVSLVQGIGGYYNPGREPDFAEAISTKPFRFNSRERGIIFDISAHNIDCGYSVVKFIDSLVEYNDAEMDCQRALREGAYLSRLLSEQTKHLEFKERAGGIPKLK